MEDLGRKNRKLHLRELFKGVGTGEKGNRRK